MNKHKESSPNKAGLLSSKSGTRSAVLEFLTTAMNKGVFDAVMVPMRVPAGDLFTYVLIKDTPLLKDGFPLPPVMSVQGANAISSITRLGKGTIKIAALMRPCEVRATIELAKASQVNLDNVTLISIDCPGTLSLSDFLNNPDKELKVFDAAAEKWDDSVMRPICQICDKSSMIAGDIHLGTLGAKKDTVFVILNSDKGSSALEKLGINAKESIESWQAKRQLVLKKNSRNERKHI